METIDIVFLILLLVLIFFDIGSFLSKNKEDNSSEISQLKSDIEARDKMISDLEEQLKRVPTMEKYISTLEKALKKED